MAHKNPRVDAYIADSKPFARPILEHIRAIVHEACPDVQETIRYIHRAMELNEKGIQPKKKKRAKPAPEMPEDFAAELGKVSGALQAFEEMSPGYQREYIEWITDAKRESTRQRRIAKAVDQISEGKSLNWKYM